MGPMSRQSHLIILCIFVVLGAFLYFPGFFSSSVSYYVTENIIPKIKEEKKLPPLDKIAYDLKLKEIANNPAPKEAPIKIDVEGNVLPPPPTPPTLWPVKTVYPNAGALLPFNRIIAYYGNLYSRKMGVLGEYDPDEMLARLQVEVDKWNNADPYTPVIPALHYIAVVAQGSAGADGKYRNRMPDKEIDKVLEIAKKIDAIVFLDFQVAFSTLEDELPVYEKYFKMPNVHLGIDPEFSMKTGVRPGKIVGTFDAVDVNYAANFLAKIVRENNLTPKVLIVHRYTNKMLTNTDMIEPLPEVQIVIHMDGWGGAAKKFNTYKQYVYKEPVQFAGFKLFYKNDVFDPGTELLTPEELLELNPQPSYIQYQ